ncbi:MAG: TylF/MycF/NovP-related O-methyltransferase [Betaproteobacteria bacterium]
MTARKSGPVSQNTTSKSTADIRQNLYRLFAQRPMPDDELLVNLGLYIRSGALAKILFLNELYEKIVPIPGIICEFGVWWGQSLTLFENLRAVHEPYNHTRRVIGFDTFTGYPSVGERDKRSETIAEGVYGVGEGYERYLGELIEYHEQENVMAHIRKHALVKGDASVTVPGYFKEHPESIVALAFFDMALYEPTRICLQAIMPRLVKGSVIAFDEFGHKDYPGETLAVVETLGLRTHRLFKSKFLPDRCYFVIE